MLWVAIILAVLLALFLRLYWRSLDESRHLVNYVLLVLLDEEVYATQRNSLEQFVRNANAKDPADLGIQTLRTLHDLAGRLGHTVLSTTQMLWRLRERPQNLPS